MVSPEDKRAAIAHVRQVHGVSERRACGLIGQTRSTQRYRAKTKAEDGVRRRIAELAAERPRFGYRRLTALLKRKRKSNPIYLEPGKHDEVREWQMETREHVHRG